MNPLTGLYTAVSTLRNTLFDRGVLSSRRLEQPVVSVGNLSVGGSGKTPFVIALGELLTERGIPFDVLTRGYRRKTRGVLVVDPNGAAADFGDEPLLIARRLGVPVIVGESRYQAGRLAEQKFQSQLHLLDDGFQHRYLARDFDIVLVTERDFDDQLLPSGRLREPLSSLARADAVVLPAGWAVDHPALTACETSRSAEEQRPPGLKPAVILEGLRGPEGPLFHGGANIPDGGADFPEFFRKLLQQKMVWGVQRNLVLSSAPAAPIVFCGIARPEQFFAQVRAAGITPAAEIEFRDHHAYKRSDIDRLLATCDKLGASGFVTTEKDAINLGPLQDELKPIAVATLRLTLDHPADVVEAVVGRIAERKPRS
jgi:tetraacyldisaccharide 4'-kinase